MSRIDEIVNMCIELSNELTRKNCYGCLNDCGSQKDHPCCWASPIEYRIEALMLLYGQGSITEDEYSETINYL
jgi:hypothetical protein